jgi:hypothetical protein
MKWLDNFLFGNPLLRIVPPLEPLPFVTEEGREIERLRAELAAMEKQRDEARENLRDACKESAIRVNTHAMSMMELENEFSARVTMAFVAAMRKGEQDGN